MLSTKEANEAARSRSPGRYKTIMHPLRYAGTRDDDSWVPRCPEYVCTVDSQYVKYQTPNGDRRVPLLPDPSCYKIRSPTILQVQPT